MFDFQRLRRNTDITSAPLLAASIFLDILNVFLFFLAIFSGQEKMTASMRSWLATTASRPPGAFYKDLHAPPRVVPPEHHTAQCVAGSCTATVHGPDRASAARG